MNLVKITSILATLVVFSGCASLGKRNAGTLAKTNTQAMNTAADNEESKDVLLAAIMKNQQILADRLANVQDKGLSHQLEWEFHERDKDGEMVKDANGLYVPVKMRATAKWSSMHEMAGGCDTFKLRVNAASEVMMDPNNHYNGPLMDGITLEITGAKGGGLSGAYEKERATGRAGEKAAIGEALGKVIELDWKGRKETAVEIIKSTGEVAKGVLVSLDPYGAIASGLSKVIVKKLDGTKDSVIVPNPVK